MPISCPVQIRPLSQNEFRKLDFELTKFAFQCQNDLGRLCDEEIYQNALKRSAEVMGARALKEVSIHVTHDDFKKIYSLDLLVNEGAIYELKTAAGIASEHESQLLNYMLLAGVNHGKIINFRTPKVQCRFVNTTISPKERWRFEVNRSRWHDQDNRSRLLFEVFNAVIADWGIFLELPLYIEALTHFLGGEEQVCRPIPLTQNGVVLGSQKLLLLNLDTAFKVTALTETTGYERQLRTFLNLTPLQQIQWINMNQHSMEFITISKHKN